MPLAARNQEFVSLSCSPIHESGSSFHEQLSFVNARSGCQYGSRLVHVSSSVNRPWSPALSLETCLNVKGADMSTALETQPGIELTDGRVSIYQPEQQGLIFPAVPEFSNYAYQRRHLKERLVGACRAFALQGFDYGFAGHLTIDRKSTRLNYSH